MENYILSVCSSLTKFCNIICLGDPRHDVCLLLDRYYHSLYGLNRVQLTREKKAEGSTLMMMLHNIHTISKYEGTVGISDVHHVCITEVSPLKHVVMSYHQSLDWVEHSGTLLMTGQYLSPRHRLETSIAYQRGESIKQLLGETSLINLIQTPHSHLLNQMQ